MHRLWIVTEMYWAKGRWSESLCSHLMEQTEYVESMGVNLPVIRGVAAG